MKKKVIEHLQTAERQLTRAIDTNNKRWKHQAETWQKSKEGEVFKIFTHRLSANRGKIIAVIADIESLQC
jgi:hypothetical protein